VSQPAWSNNFLRNQLSLPYLDAKTNRAVYENGEWKKLFDQFASLYKIPGMENLNGAAAVDAFVKNQRVAMMKGNTELYAQMPKELNWDVTNLPSFKESPGVTEGATFFYWSVTTLSKNPEDAFLAMKELISPEVQTQMSRGGRSAVLKDKSIQQQFGADVPELKGKNTKAMSPETFATPILLGPYTLSVLSDLGNAFTSVITNKSDVNTALRNAAESTNKTIAALIQAEGAAK
jgi:multiple sugar transport system substrate-binding protein